MVSANFRQVFIGIESPRSASLIEAMKHQNVRGSTLQSKIKKIRDEGLVVQAGFIVGFDNDDKNIFDEQFNFITETGIANAMVGILSPTPTTPLFDRLKASGRLDFSDPAVVFRPQNMTREELKNGHRDLTRRLYEPEAYFERLFLGYSNSPDFRRRRAAQDALSSSGRGIGVRVAAWATGLRQAFVLALAAARAGWLGRLGPAYLRASSRYNRPLGKAAISLPAFVSVCVTHWHFYNVSHADAVQSFGNLREWSFDTPTDRFAAPLAVAAS